MDKAKCIITTMNFLLFNWIFQRHFDYNGSNEQIFQSNFQISPCVSNHSIIFPPTQVPKLKIRVDDHQGEYLL